MVLTRPVDPKIRYVAIALLASLIGLPTNTLASGAGPLVLASQVKRNSDVDYVIGVQDSKFYALDLKKGKAEYSNDATAIMQKTIGSLANVGGRIFIMAGTYPITQIVITGSNITLESEFAVLLANDRGLGTRQFSSIIQKSLDARTVEVLDSAPVLLIDRANNITVRNIVIDGNPISRNFHRDGILIWDSSGVSVENSEIRNVEGSAFRTRSSGTYDLSNPENSNLRTRNVVIKASRVKDTRTIVGQPLIKGFGYEVEFSENVTVEKSAAQDCAESMYRTHYSRHVNFLNNTGSTVLRVASGEVFDLYRSDHITVKANRIFDPEGLGIFIYEYSTNLLIQSNEIRSLDADSVQVRLEGIGKYRRARIENVTFNNNTITGKVQLSNSYLKNLMFESNRLVSLRAWPAEETPQVFENITFVSNSFLTKNVQAAVISIPMSLIRNFFLNRVEVRESTAGMVLLDSNEFTSNGLAYATGIYIGGSVEHVRATNNYFHDVTYQAIFVNVDPGLSQNGLIEIMNNRFTNNGFIGPQYTVVLEPNSVAEIMITGNYFESTPGSFTLYLNNANGTVAENTVDKPISWEG